MYDRELVLYCLNQIKDALETIIIRAKVVKKPEDFLLSQDGMLRLDAICMNLIALGEAHAPPFFLCYFLGGLEKNVYLCK